MAARDEFDDPNVELPEYDPQQRPLLDGLNGYTKFRWQKPSRPVWTSMAAKIVGCITIVLLSVTLWKVIRHHSHKAGHSDDSKIKHLTPEFFTEFDSDRVQIRYGPFDVPPSTIDNGMRNFVIKSIVPPCQDCIITWMHANLEYEDGSSANANTGLWLHHTLLINLKEPDSRGCRKSGLRFFASGNERTVADLCVSGTDKSGYHLFSSPEIAMLTELMNEHQHPQSAYVSITYEYVPGHPSEFQKVTPLWLDIGGCNGSDVAVPDKKTAFELTSTSWKTSISGRVTGILSHVHDGGVSIETLRDGKVMCRAHPGYGESPGFVEDGEMGMEHISSIASCYRPGHMTVGEEWTVRAEYDLERHMPMGDGMGGLEPVMGIAMVYVVEG